MMRTIMGSEKKTLVEEARSRMKRGKRKHQEAVVALADGLFQMVPEVVYNAAELNYPRTAWDMAKSSAFTTLNEQNKWLLLGQSDLTATEWKQIHETVISRLKAEPDLSWKPFDEDTASILVLIWDSL